MELVCLSALLFCENIPVNPGAAANSLKLKWKSRQRWKKTQQFNLRSGGQTINSMVDANIVMIFVEKLVVLMEKGTLLKPLI